MNKKNIGVLVIFAFIGTGAETLAQSTYTEAANKVELCRTVGQAGEVGYLERMNGTPKTSMGSKTYLRHITEEAYSYGYDKATDRRNAHMIGFAYCMDKVDRLAQEENERLKR